MGEARRRRLKGQTRRPDDLIFYHSLHSCGHAVYWQDWQLGMRLGLYPCPWCGGENPQPHNTPPLSATVIGSPGAGLCVRIKNPDDTLPLPASYGQGSGVIRHMTGEVCCKPPKPWPDGW